MATFAFGPQGKPKHHNVVKLKYISTIMYENHNGRNIAEVIYIMM